LQPDDVQSGIAPQETTEDIVVEILIEDETQHGVRSRLFTGQQASPQSASIEAKGVLLMRGLNHGGAFLKIRFDGGAVPQAMTDHCVNVRQPECGILLNDFLRRCAFVKSGHNGVQGHPRARHADNATFMARERHWIGGCQERVHQNI
jgi:hypothetical protein